MVANATDTVAMSSPAIACLRKSSQQVVSTRFNETYIVMFMSSVICQKQRTQRFFLDLSIKMMHVFTKKKSSKRAGYFVA